MRVLAIGNSFSQNAQTHLHQVAAVEGVEIECVNLFIGGCSLQTHWENVLSERACYQYERNGAVVWLDEAHQQPRQVSIQEALAEGGWDAITLQQCSGLSGQYETYQPYLDQLSAFVRKHAPHATQWIHQTWAYDAGSGHAAFPAYQCNQAVMYAALKNAYTLAAKAVDAPIIPAGELIQRLRSLPEFDLAQGGRTLCADTYHMNSTLGCYALAVAWFVALTGKQPQHDYIPADSQAEGKVLRALIRKTAANMGQE